MNATPSLPPDGGHLGPDAAAWWVDVDVEDPAAVDELLDALDADRGLDPDIPARAALAADAAHLRSCTTCRSLVASVAEGVRALLAAPVVATAGREEALAAALREFAATGPIAGEPATHAPVARMGWWRRGKSRDVAAGGSTGVSGSRGGFALARPATAVVAIAAVAAVSVLALGLRHGDRVGDQVALDTRTADTTAAKPRALPPAAERERVPTTADSFAADAASSDEESGGAATATSERPVTEAAPALGAAPSTDPGRTAMPKKAAPPTTMKPAATTTVAAAAPAPTVSKAAATTAPAPSVVAPVALGELGSFPDLATAVDAATTTARARGVLPPVTTTAQPAGAPTTTIAAPTTAAPAAAAPTTAAPAVSPAAGVVATVPCVASPALRGVSAVATATVGGRPVVIGLRTADVRVVVDAVTCQPLT